MITVRIPDYSASSRQTKFHTSQAFETLYGGAAGGGKTAALAAEAITEALATPGTKIYLFRRSLKELKQSLYQEIMRQIAPYQNISDSLKQVIITYNSQDSIFKFSNGSYIQMAYLDNVADRYRYQSAEIHLLLIDELTHFNFDDYEYLKTRVRSDASHKPRIMCATNPGGVGHGWVKDYFITVAEPETIYQGSNGFSRIFIPAKVDDHPNVVFRSNYRKVLEAIADEQLRKALLDGDWNTFQGQVYREFRRDRHIITAVPKEVLDVSEKYIGFDWGFNDPACAIWLAVAPENEQGVRAIYAYREVYQNQTTVEEWAKIIDSYIMEEPIEFMILPHDCYSRLGGNRTIASVFEEHDIPIVRADSLSHAAKMHRIALLHQLFAEAPDGYPYLQIHDKCANLIRTVPDLPYDEHKPEEINSNAEDHAFDALTYGLMVIVGAQSWIVDPALPQGLATSYIVDEDQTMKDYHIDLQAAIRRSAMGGERDWRYR